MDALLTTDDNGGSVQDSKNAIPAVSANTSEVLIWSVQSPDPLGDSLLLREQLVSKLTWNVLEGTIPKPSWDSPSTYSNRKQSFCTYYRYRSATFHQVSDNSLFPLTHTTSIIVQACCLKIVYNTSTRCLCQGEVQMSHGTFSDPCKCWGICLYGKKY